MLDQWAHDLDVVVRETEMPFGLWGAYHDASGMILLQRGIAPLQRRSTLAHELGHAFYRHEGTTPRQEHDASQWAARVLIKRADFMAATAVFDSPIAVAHELHVLPVDVEAYAAFLRHQRGDRVTLTPITSNCNHKKTQRSRSGT